MLCPRVSDLLCSKKKKKKKGSRKDTRSDVSLIVFRVTYLRYEDGEGEDRGEEEIKAGIVRWQRSCGLRTVER